MTDRELAAAAHHALVNLDNERELLVNALLPPNHALSYGTLRYIVLSALEGLAPDGADDADYKQRRRHAILVRCDLKGETHKSVIASMALSRRQFYRERRESLLRLGSSIRQLSTRATEPSPIDTTSDFLDLGDAAEAYIEALRSAGQYRLVLQEASALARRFAGDPREIECWLVASEAARLFADDKHARETLEAARLPIREPSNWRSFWIASSSMSVQWVAAESADARAIYERATRIDEDERSLHGKEAVLLACILVSAARMEADCGRWERARSLLVRASRLAQNGAGAKRQSLRKVSSMICRLSAMLALHADGDTARSVAGHRAALESAKSTGELGYVADTAIQYAMALSDSYVDQALSYADFGLDIVRRYYPGDRLAELTLDVVPLFLYARGADAARQAIEFARCPGLGTRDTLFLELAEAKLASHEGRFINAAERAEAVAANLFQRGIDAWACDAELVAIEAYSQLGFRSLARRKFAQLADTIVSARAGTRARAERVARSLEAPAPRVR